MMKDETAATAHRTHYCGDLRPEHVGRQVVLQAWVHRRRDLGALLFLDLRDRTGLCQVVFSQKGDAAVHGLAAELRSEYVVAVTGCVVLRSAETANASLATGEIEIAAAKLEILNTARTPPFPLTEESAEAVSEEARLTYRYLDLRR